jgi:hypothetical protein
MLYRGGRLCDFCGEPIQKGSRFAITVIPREKRGLFSFLKEQNSEIAPTFTLEPNGDVRLDLCVECSLTIHGNGSETVH